MSFKIVDELDVDLDVLVVAEGELVDEGVEVLHEVTEDGQFGLSLDELD